MILQQKLFPAFAIALGLSLLAYVLFPHGIGLSEDSISSLAAAKSLNTTGELRDIDGSWFVAWAPLYPLMIAALLHLPFAIEHALAVFNLLVFTLTLYTSWLLIVRAMEKPFFRVACLFFLVCSFTIMQVYAMALSEAVFLLLINCVALISYKPQAASRKFLLLALFCGLAMVQRYIGIFLIPVVVFFFLKREEKISIGKITAFVFISVLPLAIWLVRNYVLTETLTGFRADGGALFQKNILVLADTLTSWLLPIKISLFIRLLAFAGVLVMLRKGIFNERNHIHALLVAGYVLSLIAAYFLFSFEEPRDRLLAPVFIPFSILLFSGWERFAEHLPSFIPRAVFIGLLCLWMFYPAARIAKHISLWHTEGVDIYNKPAWKNSETLAWLRIKENVPYGNIFSNDPYAIYYFTDKNAHRVPRRMYSLEQLHQGAREGDYLVWWRDKDFFSIETLATHYRLEEKARTDDAVIFTMHLRP